MYTFGSKSEVRISSAKVQPGPGFYESSDALHYKCISGSKMGKDVRKGHFLKTPAYDKPGPGNYFDKSTFVDKKKAPSFGFGSSKRDPGYMTSKAQPGPG